MHKFKIIGKSTWKERKKKEIERKNNAKFSGHYVRPHTHYVRTKICTPYYSPLVYVYFGLLRIIAFKSGMSFIGLHLIAAGLCRKVMNKILRTSHLFLIISNYVVFMKCGLYCNMRWYMCDVDCRHKFALRKR